MARRSKALLRTICKEVALSTFRYGNLPSIRLKHMRQSERTRCGLRPVLFLIRTAHLLCVFPVPVLAQNTLAPASDLVYRSQIKEDFVKFNPDYTQFRAERAHRARILGERVFEKERQGRDV